METGFRFYTVWVVSGLSIGPASPSKFFGIRGTSAENFHFFCHFTMPGVTEIVKKAFAISTRFFTYCVTRQNCRVTQNMKTATS